MENCTVNRYFSLPVNGLQEQAPQELQDRLAIAFADHQVRGLAQRTAFRITELARKAALDHVMATAVEAADPDTGNAGILEELEKAFTEISAELAEWNAAANLSQMRARQRAAETNHLVVRAMNFIVRKRGEIGYVERQLSAQRVRTSDKAERLREAGLTEEELDTLGVLPPPVDAEKLRRQWQILTAEIEALNAFSADPLRRLSLLGDIDLDAQDGEDIQRVEKLAEADAKQAIAASEKRRTKKQLEADRLAAEKLAKDRILVDRAILIEAAKQRKIHALSGKLSVASAQGRESLNPELVGWRQQIAALQKDIAALNDFCSDYPNYRIEKVNGLLADVPKPEGV